MDKKAKKRLEVLRQKLQKQEKLLAAAKQQTDEPDEVANIERQINEIKAEIEKINLSHTDLTVSKRALHLMPAGI